MEIYEKESGKRGREFKKEEKEGGEGEKEKERRKRSSV